MVATSKPINLIVKQGNNVLATKTSDKNNITFWGDAIVRKIQNTVNKFEIVLKSCYPYKDLYSHKVTVVGQFKATEIQQFYKDIKTLINNLENIRNSVDSKSKKVIEAFKNFQEKYSTAKYSFLNDAKNHFTNNINQPNQDNQYFEETLDVVIKSLQELYPKNKKFNLEPMFVFVRFYLAVKDILNKLIQIILPEKYKAKTAFFQAVQNGDIMAVNKFIGKNNINIVNNLKEQQTALHIVSNDIKSESIEVAKKLLENGIDINAKDKLGNTALINACYNSNTDMVALLIGSGANLNIMNNKGVTPLMMATKRGNIKITTNSIENGAKINTQSKSSNTALMIAARSGDIAIAKKLIENGAEINTKNIFGNNALMKACYNSKLNIVKLLNDSGANLEEPNNIGETPLMYAINNDKLPLIETLIECGADVNTKNHKGITPLMVAAKHGDLDLARKLLKYGANVNAKDNDSETALIKIFYNSNTEAIATLLIKAGADVNAEDNNNKTALMYAISMDDSAVFDLLIGNSVNVNVKNKRGATPLIIAARKNLAATNKLIKMQADIDATDDDGITALMVAVYFKQVAIIKRLIIAGADISLVSNNGYNAIDLAKSREYYVIVEMLNTALRS